MRDESEEQEEEEDDESSYIFESDDEESIDEIHDDFNMGLLRSLKVERSNVNVQSFIKNRQIDSISNNRNYSQSLS
jgi:hypothetical protein